MNVLDIANSFDSLGEKLSDEKLVRKILRSLPRRFDMKVTAIEEAQDVSNMQVEELIGSLQNFELVVDNRTEKKGKGITFTVNTVDDEGLEENVEDENLSENLVMLGRQFIRILK
jgi:predicted ArsR family transcriptional regulator